MSVRGDGEKKLRICVYGPLNSPNKLTMHILQQICPTDIWLRISFLVYFFHLLALTK